MNPLKLWWLIVLLYLIFGCKKPASVSKENQSKDSSSSKERIVTQTVYQPGEKIYYQIPCPDAVNKKGQNKPFEFKGKNGGTMTGEVGSDNVIRGTVDCPELRATIQEKDSEISRYKKQEETYKQTNPVVENKTHWVDKFCRTYTVISFLILLLFLMRKYISRTFKNLVLPFKKLFN